MLLAQERTRILTEAGAWAQAEKEEHRFVSPAHVASWLPGYVGAFRAGLAPERGDSPSEAEIASLAVAAAFGPARAGLPPESLTSSWASRAAFAGPGDPRAVERLLVHGALLPPGREDWEHRWPGAWETLWHLIRPHLLAWLRWIAEFVLRMEPRGAREQWVEAEADATAACIRGALVLGCHCWLRWEDFHIKTQLLAHEHCATRHNLGAWDGQEPLGDFLIRAAVQEQLPVGGANDFRRGILGKVAVMESLVAGGVLRCDKPACRGELRLDDHCDACRELGRVTDDSWWLWRKGDRRAWECRRCRRCNCLYFNWMHNCPNCDARRWSIRTTEVWVLSALVPLGDPARVAGPDTGSSVPPISDWAQEKILAAVACWPAGREKEAALRFFRDNLTLEEVAQELGFKPRSSTFQQVVSAMTQRLRGLLADEEAASAAADQDDPSDAEDEAEV